MAQQPGGSFSKLITTIDNAISFIASNNDNPKTLNKGDEKSQKTSIDDVIANFNIEPVVTVNESNKYKHSNFPNILNPGAIPTSYNDAVQNAPRPMYSNSYNPIHERRNNCIQAIYQFLEEESLFVTLSQLQKETRITYDNTKSTQFGVLLEALDLRNAYHSAQLSVNDVNKHYENLLKKKQTLNEKACTKLLYKFHKIHKSNILCIDVFYYNDITYIISGCATRSLQILSCKDIDMNTNANDQNDNDNDNECIKRLISELNGIKGPPLYIDVDPKYSRYAIVTCMEGSIYIIDLYSCIDSPTKWNYKYFKPHKKYIVMGRWSKDSKYILTASHDHKATLYQFISNSDCNTFKLDLIHQYEYNGCVEAICWISGNEFIVTIRDNNHLLYYRIDDNYDNNNSHLQAYLKCNMNPFGDNHITYSIGDLRINNSASFILAKTDHEKVLLFINKKEDQIRTYYGSHSDLYTYTRCLFSKNEKYIYASHHNDFVIWDIYSGKLLHRINNAHQKTLRDMVLDQKYGFIVTTSFDRTIKIWSPE